jgi:hypothetical protein
MRAVSIARFLSFGLQDAEAHNLNVDDLFSVCVPLLFLLAAFWTSLPLAPLNFYSWLFIISFNKCSVSSSINSEVGVMRELLQVL